MERTLEWIISVIRIISYNKIIQINFVYKKHIALDKIVISIVKHLT